MTLYQDKFRTESTRLKQWDYRARGWYFVTICTSHRSHILGEIMDGHIHLSPLGTIADSDLRNLPHHYQNVELIEYIVMPNHVHAVIFIDGDHCFSPDKPALAMQTNSRRFPSPEPGSLAAILRSYKSGVTNKAHELGLKRPIWQPRFHDHLLRGDKVIAAVRDYIRNNAANWEKDPDR